MLAAAAARLQDQHDLVWVDLGGGTGVRRHCSYGMAAPRPKSARLFASIRTGT